MTSDIKCQKITASLLGKQLQSFTMLECKICHVKLMAQTDFYHIDLSMHSVICRYDMATRALKHLKPLEEKHLEFLNGDLDLLGPYPT